MAFLRPFLVIFSPSVCLCFPIWYAHSYFLVLVHNNECEFMLLQHLGLNPWSYSFKTYLWSRWGLGNSVVFMCFLLTVRLPKLSKAINFWCKLCPISFLGTAWSRKFVPIVAVLKTTHTVHCKDKFVVENKNFGMTKVSILQVGSKMAL